jgi:hypothetical protein
MVYLYDDDDDDMEDEDGRRRRASLAAAAAGAAGAAGAALAAVVLRHGHLLLNDLHAALGVNYDGAIAAALLPAHNLTIISGKPFSMIYDEHINPYMLAMVMDASRPSY